MGKLTVKELEALRQEDVGTKVRDDGGLIGTVRRNGDAISVRFCWRYRIVGRVREINVGTWPAMSLAAIRADRDAALSLVKDGIDPAEQAKADRLKTRADQAEAVAKEQVRLAELARLEARMTVADLFERWMKADVSRRKDGGKEVRRMFAKDVLPIIGDMAVEDVRKGTIAAMVLNVKERGVDRMARMILSLVRQMFRFAVETDILEADPTASISKARLTGKDVERDRVLSPDEIKALARQMPDAKLIASTKLALWLSLATCCRIGELLSAQWKDVDLKKGAWRIPPENSKNSKEHVICLSSFAVARFEELKALDAKARWCFPNRSGTGPVCNKSVSKQVGDRQRDGKEPMSRRSPHTTALLLPGGRWTPHDLRRTGASMMAELGVLPDVIERVLNHIEASKMKRIYQRHTYRPEMEQAWRLLGERLELLLNGGGNVVLLRRSAS